MRMANAQRRPVNLSLDAGAVEQARRYGLNLSRIAGEAIEKAVKAEAAARWQAENAEAIAAYNRLVEEEGLLSDLVPGWWNAPDDAV